MGLKTKNDTLKSLSNAISNAVNTITTGLANAAASVGYTNKASGGGSSGGGTTRSSGGSSGSSGSSSSGGGNKVVAQTSGGQKNSAGGTGYTVSSERGLDFLNNARPGAIMAGADGSEWKKNADGSTTITSKTGAVYNVPGVGSNGGASASGGGASGGTVLDNIASQTGDWLNSLLNVVTGGRSGGGGNSNSVVAQILGGGTNIAGGTGYTINSPAGLDFLSNATAGQTMTGGDGSQWVRNADGSTTIISKTGAVYTVPGTQSTVQQQPVVQQPQQQQVQLKDTLEMLQEMAGSYSQPEFNSEWRDISDKIANALIGMNYDDWTKSDQYKSLAARYGNQGRMSMQDVLGQIASRTGGMASSYATTAAQQQYNDYMARLEEIARQSFGEERQQMAENAQMALDYYGRDYNEYLDALAQANKDRDYNLQLLSDAIAQTNYENEWQNQLARQGIEDQRYADETAYNRAKYEDETAYNRTKYEDETAYNRAQAARKEAYDSAMTLINAGQMPDSSLLEAAGLTADNAQALVDLVNRNNARSDADWSAGYGDYSGLAGQGVDTSYLEAQKAAELEQMGKQKPLLSVAQVNAAIKAGNLTQSVLDAYEYYYGEPYGGGYYGGSTGGSPGRSGGSPGSSGRPSGGKGYNNGGLTDSEVAKVQRAYGLEDDGYWGPNSQKTTGYKSAADAKAALEGTSATPGKTESKNIETSTNLPTSVDYDQDEGLIYWNGHTYNNRAAFEDDITNAYNRGNLTSEQAQKILDKLNYLGLKF